MIRIDENAKVENKKVTESKDDIGDGSDDLNMLNLNNYRKTFGNTHISDINKFAMDLYNGVSMEADTKRAA